jgi:hypothetical protein
MLAIGIAGVTVSAFTASHKIVGLNVSSGLSLAFRQSAEVRTSVQTCRPHLQFIRLALASRPPKPAIVWTTTITPSAQTHAEHGKRRDAANPSGRPSRSGVNLPVDQSRTFGSFASRAVAYLWRPSLRPLVLSRLTGIGIPKRPKMYGPSSGASGW